MRCRWRSRGSRTCTGPGDVNWARVIPDSARALVRGERPVIRSDGTPERDYLYVEDAAAAYLAVADSLDHPALRGRAWNAGLGEPRSVLEVVKRLIEISGRLEPDIQGTGVPHGEIDRQYLDSTAIRAELGWEPKWDLDRGLRAAWEWYERDASLSPGWPVWHHGGGDSDFALDWRLLALAAPLSADSPANARQRRVTGNVDALGRTFARVHPRRDKSLHKVDCR